jgi:hypothetical protein
MKKKSNYKAIGIYGIVPIDILKDVTLNQLKVYIAIASFQGNNENAFPGMDALAKRASLIESATSKAVSELVEKGYVERKRRYGKSNLYRILVPCDDPSDSDNLDDSDNPNGLEHESLSALEHVPLNGLDDIVKEQVKITKEKEQGDNSPFSVPLQYSRVPDNYIQSIGELFMSNGSNLDRTPTFYEQINILYEIAPDPKKVEIKIKGYIERQKNEDWFKKKYLTLSNLVHYWNEIQQGSNIDVEPIKESFAGLEAIR